MCLLRSDVYEMHTKEMRKGAVLNIFAVASEKVVPAFSCLWD